MKIILSLCVLLTFFACDREKEVDNTAIANEAEKIVSDDPAVINKIQEVTILPFSLGIQYFQNIEQ